MQRAHSAPTVVLTDRPPIDIDTQLLIVPHFSDDDLADETGLDVASSGEIGRARANGELTGKLYEVFVAPLPAGSSKGARVALIGAGARADLTADRLRRLAAVGGLTARRLRATRVAVLHRAGTGVPAERAAQVLSEGITLANYDGGTHKTDAPQTVFLDHVALRVGVNGLEAALERGTVLGAWTNRARALVNAPGNELTPRIFAERAQALGAEAGLAVEVLDESRIAALGMGLLLAVAKGSQEPPRVLVLRHEPADAPSEVVLGLVGKGVTFDTGGISIKAADNMDKMKDDMAGGAAVVCAAAAIAQLRVPLRCIAVVPMAENMPGGRAVKPGDVLTSASGKTVEVLNTDAEGRLVLGDGVWYARQLGVTHLVDVATLTGACVVALGKTTSGLFGTPDAWVEHVRRAGDRAGDRSWPMPVFEDYKELLKSEVADFSNTGGRAGGAITGALFIKEFAGDLPWVHMDIAGTAWADEGKAYQPAGATGVGVRTLVELALDAPTWSRPPSGG